MGGNAHSTKKENRQKAMPHLPKAIRRQQEARRRKKSGESGPKIISLEDWTE